MRRDLPFSGAHDAGALVALPEGRAIADPENGKLRLVIAAGEDFDAVDARLASARVAAAVALRRGLGLVEKGAAYRLIHGAADGLPGIAADALGAWAVVYAYGRALLPLARLVAQALVDRAPMRGAVVKLRARGGAADVEQEIVGAAPPPKLVVKELGVPFETHPLGGLNTGLFTDMREHRAGLARIAHGRRVLNGFAYTGALSVACARAGAAAVTSVDLSSGVLAWAADNFRRSDLDPDSPRYRFVDDDVGRALGRFQKDGERFDLILLDPPAYSTARGAPWAIERDYPKLVARARALLAEGGLLWLAANTRAIGAIGDLAPDASVLELGGLPPDYPTLVEQPEDRYLQVGLFRP